MSVPARLGEDTGLPVGLQIIGNYFAEEKLLSAGAAYEEAIGFDTTPPLVHS